MAKKITLFLLVSILISFALLSDIIFSYDRCKRQLENVSFYGSVQFMEESGNVIKLYIQTGPDSIFLIIAGKDVLNLDNYDLLYSNPVFFEARYWNWNYEIYSQNSIKFSEYKINKQIISTKKYSR